MAEIADDCFDLAMDELDRNYTNPDWVMHQEQLSRQRFNTCTHNFQLGRCPNKGCDGHEDVWMPFQVIYDN